MQNIDRLERRAFIGATTTGATLLLAGCSDDGGGDSEDEADGDGGSSGMLDEEPDYGDWFDDVDNYEGTVDMTGQDEVEVANGAGDGLRFDPAAVAVSPGTTVVWEWTGEGGQHNVAAADGSFESDTVSEQGFTFEHTFEEEGVFEYICTPHEAVGMKGAVVVQ